MSEIQGYIKNEVRRDKRQAASMAYQEAKARTAAALESWLAAQREATRLATAYQDRHRECEAAHEAYIKLI